MQEEAFASILKQCPGICLVIVLSVSTLIHVSESLGQESNQTSQIQSRSRLLRTALHHENILRVSSDLPRGDAWNQNVSFCSQWCHSNTLSPGSIRQFSLQHMFVPKRSGAFA
jgi:hypothetical protein